MAGEIGEIYSGEQRRKEENLNKAIKIILTPTSCHFSHHQTLFWECYFVHEKYCLFQFYI